MLWRRARPQPTGKLPSSRFFRFWRCTRRVTGGFAVALAIALVSAPAVTKHLLEKESARIRAAREPFTCADLVQVLPPGTLNAADVYQQAFDARDLTEEEGELLGHLHDEELPPGLTESMRPALARNEEYFALLEEAADIDICVFPVEWEKRAEATLPHLAGVREAARMVGVRALVLAVDGRAEEALQGCSIIPAMAQHLSSEPAISSQLVRYALLSVGKQGIEQALNRCNPSAEACRKVYDAYGEVKLSESLLRAVKGHRAWCRESAFDVVREGLPPRANWGIHLAEAQLNNDERGYLRVMREQMDALALPWPEAKERADAILDRFLGGPAWVHLTADLIILSLGRAAEACRLAEGRRDVCRIGLALRAYQAEHGRYPNSLEELAGEGWEIPHDSFSGGPYRYRREDDGFLVWGVGPDLDDDGGKPFSPSPSPSRARNRPRSDEERARANDYDIVFRCGR